MLELLVSANASTPEGLARLLRDVAETIEGVDGGGSHWAMEDRLKGKAPEESIAFTVMGEEHV